MGMHAEFYNQKDSRQPEERRLTLLTNLVFLFIAFGVLCWILALLLLSAFLALTDDAENVIWRGEREQKAQYLEGFSELKAGIYPLNMNEDGAYFEQINAYFIVQYPDGKMIKTSAIPKSAVQFGISVDEQVYISQGIYSSDVLILLPESTEETAGSQKTNQ